MGSVAGALIAAALPSRLRIWLYRLQGAKIGRSVSIGLGTVIIADHIEIGDHSRIGHLCRIKVSDMRLDQRVVIESSVKIIVNRLRMDSRSIINTGVYVSGDHEDQRSVLSLGMHSWIFYDCFINCARAVIMGKNVGVGGGSYIFTHGFWLNKLDGFPVSFGDVVIKDNVWLPWGCFIMPGVTIEENVIVGARSLVNRSVPKNALVAGSPARVVREQSFADVTTDERIEVLRTSAQEFAASTGAAFSEADLNSRIDFLLDDAAFLAVHLPGATPQLQRGALNLIFGQVDPTIAADIACLSLENYHSSSDTVIAPLARRWLQFARSFGMRYYPIDELPREVGPEGDGDNSR